MRTLLALLVILLPPAVHAAHADPAAIATPDDDAGPKSKVEATGLALGGTLVGPALIAVAMAEGNRYDGPLHTEFWPMMAVGGAALVFGPSLGNWYAGKGLSAGLGLRVLGGLVGGIGLATFGANLFTSDSGTNAGFVMMIAGAGAVVVGTGLDIVEAPRAAGAYNRSHRRLAVAPWVSPSTATGRASGLAIAGTF